MRKMLLSTSFLTLGMPVMGGILFLVGSGAISRIYSGEIPDIWFFVLGEILILFTLISGYTMIKRREVARLFLPSIKGMIAIVSGVIVIIGCIAFGLGLAYFYLLK